MATFPPSVSITRGAHASHCALVSHTVAKTFREGVFVYTLNWLMLREAAQTKWRNVHKCRSPLGDQLSHTGPYRWGDLKARTTEASCHIESVKARSSIQNGS